MPTRSQRHKEETQGSAGRFPVIGAWVAGTDTVTPVAISGGNARCERLGADNPRISKQITGLVAGKTYRIDFAHTLGTPGVTTYYRVSSTANLTTGDYVQLLVSTTGPFSVSFTAPAGGVVYFGGVLVSTVNGQFYLTKDQFTITRTN